MIKSPPVLLTWFVVVVASYWTTSKPLVTTTTAFVTVHKSVGVAKPFSVKTRARSLWSTPSDDDAADAEGANLASELFKIAQAQGVSVDADDLLDDDDEDEDDDEDDEDEPETNFPAGAVNAFLGYDQGITDADDVMAGNVSLTDDQLYSEVKERVLDTAGGFVQYVKGASDSEDDDDGDDDDAVLAGAGESRMRKQKYTPPTTVPDSDLTAGEVVLLVLQALANNDNPSTNRGVEILFGYSSAGSQIKNEVGLTPKEYAEFLQETEYKVLFTHDTDEVVS